jgi:hypothetical protein
MAAEPAFGGSYREAFGFQIRTMLSGSRTEKSPEGDASARSARRSDSKSFTRSPKR